MILKKLTLRNYLQHRDVTKDFEGTLIAVVGPNGSGKSNLFGAIQFAFTGEQQGYNKDELISWGSSDGSVTVEFTHNGIDGEITRNLHNAGCTFKFGNDDYNTAKRVEEAIKVHLDLDKELAKQAVFVQQAAIDAILFTDPRIRELAFQKLMGIGSANKIHEVLGKVIAEQAEPPNYDEQIGQGKARWSEMHERMKGLESNLAQLSQRRQLLPSVDECKAKIELKRQVMALAIRAQSVAAGMVTQGTEYKTAVAAAAERAPIIAVPLENIDNELHSKRTLLLNMTNYNSARQDWERAGTAVLNLGQAPHSQEVVDAITAESETLSAMLNQALGRWKLHQDMLTALEKDGTKMESCPVCGGTITSKDALSQRLKQILASLESAGAELRAQFTSVTNQMSHMTKAMTDFATRYRAAVATYNAADERLKRFGSMGDTSEATCSRLRQEIAEMEQSKATWVSAMTSHRLYTQQADTAKAAIEKADAELQTLRKHWDSLQCGAWEDMISILGRVSPEIQELERQRDELTKLDSDVAQFQGAATELRNAMDSLDKSVAALEYKRASQQTHRDAMATLMRVRDWFHYKNGPHTLSAGVLASMTEEINSFLDQFSAPFTVSPAGDTLGFLLHFNDGRPQPLIPPSASKLSGGEKIQLALAFRFAAYRMFAAKLGLLSLDEPTVYLDDRNVDRFGDLLHRVKQVAKGMNLQLLIATHERSVIPVCDTVLDLDSKDTPYSELN